MAKAHNQKSLDTRRDVRVDRHTKRRLFHTWEAGPPSCGWRLLLRISNDIPDSRTNNRERAASLIPESRSGTEKATNCRGAARRANVFNARSAAFNVGRRCVRPVTNFNLEWEMGRLG